MAVWRRDGEADRAPLHYTQCGLDDVYLASGYEVTATPYGEGVTIKDMDGLHEAIGHFIVSHRKVLSGKEIRFLRKQLGLSQAQLAVLLDCDSQSVARWEKETSKIKGPADRMLRTLFMLQRKDGSDLGDKVRTTLAQLSELDDELCDNVFFKKTNGKWKVAEPAKAA